MPSFSTPPAPAEGAPPADAARDGARHAAEILERVGDAHVAFDGALRYVAVNAAAERSMGRPRSALLGRTLTEAFPAVAGSEVERQYRRVAAEGVEAHFTHHYVGDGLDAHVEIDAYPTELPAGSGGAGGGGPFGVAVFWRDVTARVRAEQALRDANAELAAGNARLREQAAALAAQVEAADRATAALRAQEQVLRTVAENATLALFIMDARQQCTYMNPAAERLTGYTLAETRGRALHDVVHHTRPDGRPYPLAECPIDRALPQNAREQGTETFVHRDGTFYPVAFTASPLRDEATGAPVGTIIEVRGIGAEQQAAAEREYLLAAERSARRRTERLQALTAALARARTPEAVLAAVDAEVGDAALGDAEVGDAAAGGDGTADRALDRALDRAADEAFRRAVADQCAQALERARLAAAADAALARLDGLFAEAPVGLAFFDGALRYERVNATLARYNGLPAEAHLGRTMGEVFGPRAARFEAVLGEVLATGVPSLNLEAHGGVADGPDGVRDWVASFFPVRRAPGPDARLADGDAGVLGVGLVVEDVTERRRAQHAAEAEREAAEAARRAADAANAAKSQFLANMSHELRTPLNAIAGYAELIDMGLRGPVTEAQRADLARIRRAQQHLLGLINDVLNYAKLEAGRASYAIADVALGPVLDDVAGLVTPQIAARGLSAAFAPCAPSLAVRADREKLQQVLLNLLTNAAKFTDAPGAITVTAEDAGTAAGVVRVRVRDTGIGIPADRLEHIFEPFVQVDPRLARAREGTGLGLAISRDLARGMGGELAVESAVGVGSVFTLTLPRAPADGPADDPGDAGRAAGADERDVADPAGAPPADGGAHAATVRECAAALAEGGVYAVLGRLNRRTAHRFTGLYRFDAPTLRNVALFDRADPALRVGADAPMRETYCAIVGQVGGPFATPDAPADAALAEHPAREVVQAYCGALVRDARGTPLGTVCHFDVEPRPVPAAEVPVLEAVAALLAAAVEASAPPAGPPAG